MKNTFLGYEDIIVRNFYKISETSDFRYFFKDFDGVNNKELTNKENLTFADRFKQIFLDRIEYLDDYKTKEYYRKLNEVEILKMKVYRISQTVKTISEIPLKNKYFEKFVQDLKEEGLKFGKPIKTEAERIVYLKLMASKIKGFNTKLSALKLEYKDIFKPKKEQKQDLVKEMIVLQEIHPNQRIDINKMTLQHWDGLVKLAQEKNKENKQQMEKIKR